MSKSSYRIPFVKNTGGRGGRGSSMLEYTPADDGQVRTGRAGVPEWLVPDEWRDNEPFKAAIRLTGHGRGRSSVRVSAVNEDNGDYYSMAIAAFYEAVTRFGASKGVIRGTWMFRKQGTNYTLWPVYKKGSFRMNDSKKGWIGVDLDGTLAQYNSGDEIASIGPPIPKMVDRVKTWLVEGKDVRIFTARVGPGHTATQIGTQIHMITAWCLAHLDAALSVTATKDLHMVELYDDRAIGVVKNTGDLATEVAFRRGRDAEADAELLAETLW